MWRIAAPMILSNISVPLLGMVDTGVTGHLDSPAYLGAVAIGATIFSFIYMGMNFLRMGTTGIAAQFFGAEDFQGVRAALGQSVIVGVVIGLLFVVFQGPVGTLALRLIGGDAETTRYAAVYFDIRIWSAPATLANYALIGWFIGLQNARVPLYIFLTVNITNIILDLFFVVVMNMTVDGVALASVIAEYAGLMVAIGATMHLLRQNRSEWPVHRFIRIREYAAFFSVNANLFIRTMALMLAFGFLTAKGARLGGVILAANAVLMQFQTLASFGLDGIAHAAEALVGKAVGERRRDAFAEAVRLTLRWSLIFAIGFVIAYVFAGRWLVNLLTDIEPVRETAIRYLPWIIVSPLISVWSFLYDGVFVGATRVKSMRNVMLASLICVFLPALYLLKPWGNDGLWLAFLLFMGSRGIGMYIGYRRIRVQPFGRSTSPNIAEQPGQ